MSKQSKTIRDKMKDPIFREAWIKKSRKGALMTKNRYKFTKEDQSKGGKSASIRFPPDFKHYWIREKEKLQELREEFDCIFNPKVCDGIAFKDGKIIFIEIKCGRGDLNKNQRAFREQIEKAGLEYRLIRLNSLGSHRLRRFNANYGD